MSEKYQPTLGQLWKLGVKEKTFRERLNALLAEYPPGRTCERCGGMMIHERLHGYRCARGCQQ